MASKTTSDTSRECPNCGRSFKPQGYKRHVSTCVPSDELQQADRAFEEKLEADRRARDTAMLAGYSGMPALETRPRILEDPHATAAPVAGTDDAAGFRLETRADAKRKEKGASTLGSRAMPSHDENLRLETRPKSKEAKASHQRIASRTVNQKQTTSPPSGSEPRTPLSPTQPQDEPKIDDIRTTYHPATGRPSVVNHFEEYGQDTPSPRRSSRRKPWLPFRSKTEFDFAELVHKAALSSKMVDELISIVNTLKDNHEEFFFLKNHGDLDKLWDKATSRHVPFERAEIKVPYGSSVRTVEFWSRHFKDWLAMVLDDDHVGDTIVLDPMMIEKFDGVEWERVIHEPYTADRAWELQARIPVGARVLLITLYADKTRLSSFGTAMGHPIMARIDSLPDSVRSGKGLGATQVLGWLPIIAEEESEKGKPEWVNFKRAVYHECLKHLLSTIAYDSKHGGVYKCGRQGYLTLYPSIYVLAADFEEHTTMTLTRGVKALFPCTVCKCPRDELSDLSKRHPLHTAEESKSIWAQAQRLTTKAAQERLFKAESLRNVENAFWSVNCDPHQAVTFDKLHANDHGLGGKHLYPEAKRLINELQGSRSGADTIEKQFAAFPPWKGLRVRFRGSPLSQHFADGNQFRDIMKMFIYASHNVLGTDDESDGYVLLCVFRRYATMVMYQDLEVHTSKTLKEARKAVQEFGAALKAYEEVLAGTIPGYDDIEDGGDGDSDDDTDTRPMEDETENDNSNKYKPSLTRTKDLNFPKLHNQGHAIDDIEAKGALHYFSTRYFEGLHRSFKKWYQSTTNFRNVEPQILKAECRKITASIMRELVDDYEKYGDAGNIDQEAIADDSDEDEGSAKDSHTFGNIYLGSPEKKRSFKQVQAAHMGRPSFDKLWERSMRKIKELLERPDSPIHATREDVKAAVVAITKDDPVVIQYRLIKPTYESIVDWRAHTDYLHAHPTYRKTGRFDCVIVDSNPRPLFARLVFVYTVALNIQVDGEHKVVQIPLALVQPFKENAKMSQRDKDFRLLRLKLMPEDSCRIVPARSIIRGAYIVSEGEDFETSLIVDVVDTDMFLRLERLYPLD